MNPNIVQNPYTVGGNILTVERFYGRGDVLRRIENLVQRQQSPYAIRLHGQRRMGKTSTIRVATQLLHDKAFTVYVDTSAHRNLQAILSAIVDSCLVDYRSQHDEKLNPKLLAFEKREKIDGASFLQDFLGPLAEAVKPRQVLLMFDEFESLADPLLRDYRLEFLQLLLSWLESGLLRFIFVIGHSEIALGTDFERLFRLVEDLKISFFSAEELHQALEVPSKGLLKFSAEALNAIYDLTHGHPLYANAFGHYLFQQFLEKENYTLQEYDVYEVVDKVAAFLPDAVAYQLSQNMTPAEMQMLVEIMLRSRKNNNRFVPVEEIRSNFGGLQLTSASNWQILQKLQQRELIGLRMNEEYSRQEVFYLVEPMRLWVESHGKAPKKDALRSDLKQYQDELPSAVEHHPEVSPESYQADYSAAYERLRGLEPLEIQNWRRDSYIAELVQEAEAAVDAGETDLALQLYLRAIDLDAYRIPLWLGLVSLLDEPNEKRLALENILKIDPLNSEARSLLGQIDRPRPQRKTADSKKLNPFRRSTIEEGSLENTGNQAASLAASILGDVPSEASETGLDLFAGLGFEAEDDDDDLPMLGLIGQTAETPLAIAEPGPDLLPEAKPDATKESWFAASLAQIQAAFRQDTIENSFADFLEYSNPIGLWERMIAVIRNGLSSYEEENLTS